MDGWMWDFEQWELGLLVSELGQCGFWAEYLALLTGCPLRMVKLLISGTT
jgi:hypothetical protein